MKLGPFHLVGHCTFCGTSDVYVYPAPRCEMVDLGFDLTKCQTFETDPTFCAPCCGMQEDGHDFEHEQGHGWCCKHCAEEPPNDFFNDW